jgi:hypothetical protein
MTSDSPRYRVDNEAVRNLNCLLRRGKRQEASAASPAERQKATVKGLGGSANLRISGLNAS